MELCELAFYSKIRKVYFKNTSENVYIYKIIVSNENI